MSYTDEDVLPDASKTEPELGVDTEEVGLTDSPAFTYPVPESERMGISTNHATDPAVTDQVDEENEDKIWGTPDDVVEEKEVPSGRIVM